VDSGALTAAVARTPPTSAEPRATSTWPESALEGRGGRSSARVQDICNFRVIAVSPRIFCLVARSMDDDECTPLRPPQPAFGAGPGTELAREAPAPRRRRRLAAEQAGEERRAQRPRGITGEAAELGLSCDTLEELLFVRAARTRRPRSLWQQNSVNLCAGERFRGGSAVVARRTPAGPCRRCCSACGSRRYRAHRLPYPGAQPAAG
jgi:hypothetical protein